MTVFQPESAEHLSATLAAANARRETIASLDLQRLDKLLEHSPEDMTATVQAGLDLFSFQSILARHQQWLPIDPPIPEKIPISLLLSHNLSGPRRCGCGTIRDYLIGIKVALATGEIIKAGGKVVKNVAGYDLCKLFVGAKNSLGIIIEATFKLRPLPELETILSLQLESIDVAARLTQQVLSSPMEPIIFDLHNSRATLPFTIVIGFAGAREDVEHQVSLARSIGFRDEATLDYEAEFWRQLEPPGKVSVLPSRVFDTLGKILPGSFVARLANGTVFYRESNFQQPSALPLNLMQRVKAAYDPNHTLPEYSA